MHGLKKRHRSMPASMTGCDKHDRLQQIRNADRGERPFDRSPCTAMHAPLVTDNSRENSGESPISIWKTGSARVLQVRCQKSGALDCPERVGFGRQNSGQRRHHTTQRVPQGASEPLKVRRPIPCRNLEQGVWLVSCREI